MGESENGTEDTKPEGEVYHHGGAGNVVASTGVEDQVIAETTLNTYWKANLALLFKLLGIWFLVSFGAAILFGQVLDNFQFFGFKLGFWFAQQGAIYVFVILIFVYAHAMKKLERRLGLDDDDHFEKTSPQGEEGEQS